MPFDDTFPELYAFPADDDYPLPGNEAWEHIYYKRLAPYVLTDLANGAILQKIVHAYAHPTADIWTLTSGTNGQPGYADAGDPDRAPGWLLPWLAQFPGVRLQPRDTEDQQRARIKQAAGFYRGTARAIIEEIQHLLTGTKTVMLVAPSDGPWTITTGVTADQIPAGVTTSQLQAAMTAQTPVWDIGTFYVVTDDMLLPFEATVVAHRETVDGFDTYVEDPAGPTLGGWEAIGGTIGDWETS